MTLSTLRGINDGEPTTTPIGFVLAGNRLVTVRYATPKPFLAFADHVRREPELARDAMTVLVRLLDAIIDRLADELEGIGRGNRGDFEPDLPPGDGRTAHSRRPG